MTLTTRHRASIFQSLSPILGEEEADALLTEFPAAEHDELVTKQFLRAELAGLQTELKGDIAGLRTELKGDIAGLRTEFKGDIAGLRTEFKGDIAGLQTELKGDIAGLQTELKGDIADLAERLTDRLRLQTAWIAGATISGLGLAAGIAQAIG